MADHLKMRELARDLIRDSIVEDALAQFVSLALEHVHDERIKPLRAEVERLRATTPEVAALVAASTALRDQIARWHAGGPAAGPDESRALFEALDDAIAKWEAAQK